MPVEEDTMRDAGRGDSGEVGVMTTGGLVFLLVSLTHKGPGDKQPTRMNRGG